MPRSRRGSPSPRKGPSKLLALQEHAMKSIYRALSNLRKLEQAKWTLFTAKNRHLQLKEAFSKAQELDAKINMLATDVHRSTVNYFVSNMFLQCEDSFNKASDFLAELIGSLEVPSFANQVGTTPNVASRALSHLPRMNLPTYDGDLSTWESFRYQFLSLIHNDAAFSVIEKMHFLKTSLTGDALRAMNHLLVTETNYDTA